MTREIKDSVPEKNISWYGLKKSESKTNYRRNCKNLKKINKRARNDFKKSIAAIEKEPKLFHAYIRSKLSL